MSKPKILVSLVLIIYILFAIFGFMGNEFVSYSLESLLLPIITISYFLFYNKKNFFFSAFILLYALSDLIGLGMYYMSYNNSSNFISNFDYYLGNSLYILAYIFLSIEICKKVSLKHILQNFKIHLIILTLLNTWLVYVLQVIVEPKLNTLGEYCIELFYNIILLVLLTGALLNYFYKDNQKAFYFFLGALCIVFSEVIEVAYIYISKRSLLGFFSTSLTLVAFYFFCKQTGFLDVRDEEIHIAIE